MVRLFFQKNMKSIDKEFNIDVRIETGRTRDSERTQMKIKRPELIQNYLI